jgi:hypothetical protein
MHSCLASFNIGPFIKIQLINGGEIHKKVTLRKNNGTLGLVVCTPLPPQVTVELIARVW